MADLGTSQILSITPLVYPLVSLSVHTGIGYSKTIQALSNPSPALLSSSGFNIGGTQDNSYHPPTTGQLWPRGDLDAERK